MNSRVSACRPYGQADNSYRTAGGLQGIRRLVDDFYDRIEADPAAAGIRRWHQEDLGQVRERLTWFLSGWLGGERLYQQNVGDISIPGFHRRFRIGKAERDAWLACMQHAVDRQDWPVDFKTYLMEQLAIPAERCRTID